MQLTAFYTTNAKQQGYTPTQTTNTRAAASDAARQLNFALRPASPGDAKNALVDRATDAAL